ncbi:GntR family transcriptional regulator [Anaerorhabdus sp.]|uniref:GntR family transcriptional regulator n=1 Tax=Anaerorhabdus sp. TaxID=1872524 RepID=UPI002FC857CD
MNSNKPLYQIIKNNIKEDIKSGKYQQNSKIPSETELGDFYHTSRITVVRALNDLVSEGYLYREHGKGTFVNHQIRENVMNLVGFNERMRNLDLPLRTILLERCIVQIPKEMANYFNLPEDTDVIFIKRLRIVEDKKLCLSKAYFMKENNEWLLTEDLENNSIYKLLENQYKQKLGKGTQLFGVECLDKKDTKELGVEENKALLRLKLFTYLENDKPFEFDTTYYNQDFYEYEIELNRK